jgi:TonB family protein
VVHFWLQQSSAIHRLASIALVALIHIVLVAVLLNAGFRTTATFARDSMTVQLVDASPEPLTAPALPEPALDIADLENISLMVPVAIEMSDPADNLMNAAPILATELPMEVVKDLGRRAGLAENIQATAVLRIEVLSDGRAGSVIVERSGGSDAIDAAAVDYVRCLTWIPGYLSGQAVPITIRMAVHLSG